MKRTRLILLVILLGVLIPGSAQSIDIEDITKILPLAIGNNQIGMMFADGLDKEYGIYHNAQQEARVQNVSRRLIPPEKKYDIAILNSWQFNACSIYGNHIRVFRGLVEETVNSDNELAAVLAHEIGHNELGHNHEMVENFKIAYVLKLTKLDQNLPELLQLAASAALAKRSRKLETRADEYMLKNLDQKGFKVAGSISLMRRIEAEHRFEEEKAKRGPIEQKFAQIFATHPEPATRVAMAEDYLFTKKYGESFKSVAGASTTDTFPIVYKFDWPVGPPDNSLDRAECVDGDWHIGTDRDDNGDGITDGDFRDKSYKGIFHLGTDLNWRTGNADAGKPVHAVADGKVADIKSVPRGNDGWRGVVLIKHRLPDGKYITSQYAHLDPIDSQIQINHPVEFNQKVGEISAKTPIGSQAPHLHFEMRDNPDLSITEGSGYKSDTTGWLNPLQFIKEHRRMTPPTPAPKPRDKILIYQGPYHLGDDQKGSEAHEDANFNLNDADLQHRHEAFIKLRVKGTPRKDPIVFINRKEITRIVTEDDQWHWYEAPVRLDWVRSGRNLFHIQSFIPDRRLNYDDCTFADVYLVFKPT